MFERFTEPARQVVALAHEESDRLGHNYVGCEHFLAGLARQPAAGAARVLSAGVVDEIHLVIAPFFIGDPSAPRFVGAGAFPQGPGNRMVLAETRQLGDLVLLRYLPHH